VQHARTKQLAYKPNNASSECSSKAALLGAVQYWV